MEKCTTANLWSYVMKLKNDALNNYPSPQDSARRTHEQIFSKTQVNINAKYFKLFGCPVFILDNALQQQNTYHKWKEKAKVGIYLGKSPQHVSLVPSLTTSLVSPQFHAKHDPSFDVLLQQTFKSNWQTKAKFLTKREIQPGLRSTILSITENI